MTQMQTLMMIKRIDKQMYTKMLDEYIEDGVTYTREEISDIYDSIVAKKKAVKV